MNIVECEGPVAVLRREYGTVYGLETADGILVDVDELDGVCLLDVPAALHGHVSQAHDWAVKHNQDCAWEEFQEASQDYEASYAEVMERLFPR